VIDTENEYNNSRNYTCIRESSHFNESDDDKKRNKINTSIVCKLCIFTLKLTVKSIGYIAIQCWRISDLIVLTQLFLLQRMALFGIDIAYSTERTGLKSGSNMLKMVRNGAIQCTWSLESFVLLLAVFLAYFEMSALTRFE
jgi:hypothetical protein